MSAAQSWLVVGGLFNLFFSVLAAYTLYWIRVRDPSKPAPHYGTITHTSSVTNGLLLLGLSVAIDYTQFTQTIATGLAIAEVIVTLLANARNVLLWREGLPDGFMNVSNTRLRIRGMGNLIHLLVITAIFYGVVRTALGL